MDVEKSICNVLVADDSRNDLQLLVLTLKTQTHFRVVYEASNGSDVIAYLKGQPPFNNRRYFPMPHLLVLDFKLPVVDGFEVLQWIQLHKTLKLVTVVFTGSADPTDEARARALGADAFFMKPVGLDHIREIAGLIERFMQTAPKGIRCEPSPKPGNG